MSMLEERIKRSAKKTPPAAGPAKQSAPERTQPPNSTATFLRKPAQEDPNKLKYAQHGASCRRWVSGRGVRVDRSVLSSVGSRSGWHCDQGTGVCTG